MAVLAGGRGGLGDQLPGRHPGKPAAPGQAGCAGQGWDYGIDQVVGADIVKAYGGTVKVLGLVENSSTTAIVEKIRKH
jgi:D-beta-D-heptose 7-phosphate kinase/D-beta-D-heptose 1-phosphate adenosyltransferase